VLEHLPPRLWSDKRPKRSYVSQVLARAEVDSSYTGRPASCSRLLDTGTTY